MPEPLIRRQPQFASPDAPGGADSDAVRRAPRPQIEDPLEELARILGESGGAPARPETMADARRGGVSARPMPQQLSALEAELFDELRSSVTPDTRVRGDFEREIPAPIPQQPVDDRDIASLRISPAEPTPEPPRSAEGTQAQWSDFYAYDDGVAAGSYDPAFAAPVPRAPVAAPTADVYGRPTRPEPGYPHATFDEFGRDEIAEAAREASPPVAAEPRIMPHSREEERAARRVAQDGTGNGFKIAVAAIVVMLLGGGGLAAWKFTGATGTGEPVLVHADGKPLKTIPDPSKAPVADASPTLAPDDPKAASRIVSKQEDPVDQVSGRTPEGKEVRLINPGAQRPTSDTPHTVKTVVVRPDGSIVSDGTTVRAAKTTTVAPPAQAPAPAQPVQTPATNPQAAQMPANAEMPKPVASIPVAPPVETKAPPVETRIPTPKPAPTAAAPAPAPAVTPVKTVAVTPVAPPKPAPAAPKAGETAAPMSLGPVGPKLVTTQPITPPAAPPAAAKPAAPAPAAAPVAITPPAAGGGDFAVQISASGSEAEARSSFAAAQKKYGALAGRSVDIQRADLGAKGVFFRTRVAAGSRDQAAALCAQIQSQGGQCMVVKR